MHNIIKRTGAIISMFAMTSAASFAQNAEKVKNLSEKDPHGIIMSITAACVVFIVLLALYVIYRYVGKGFNGELKRKRKSAAEGMTQEVALAIAMALDKEASGEVQAAIATALHMYMDDTVHDEESFVITIRQTPSAWNSKQFTLRQLPIKK